MAKAAAENKKPTVPFPEELEIHRPALAAAQVGADDPVEWPEGERLLRARGPEAMAEILIKAFHISIRRRAIAYLWKENMGDGARVKLGHAQRASATVKFLGEVDFVLCFNHSAWKILTFEQRVALVDHELMHCDVDSESGNPILVHHDVEEFGLIVRRWGLWKPDLRSFGDCVKPHLQIDLWDEGPPKANGTKVTPLRTLE